MRSCERVSTHFQTRYRFVPYLGKGILNLEDRQDRNVEEIGMWKWYAIKMTHNLQIARHLGPRWVCFLTKIRVNELISELRKARDFLVVYQ